MNQDVTSSQGKREAWEWIKALAVAVALAFVIRMFLFEPFYVQGESMEFTLHNGEKVVVNKAVYYWSEPRPGDIVVFHAEARRDYIKRVIAVAKDTVEIRYDQVYVNGRVIDEPYLAELRGRFGSRIMEDLKPVTVPEGHIFVMGDNRVNSHDSRAIGPVRVDEVVGRAEFVFWPLDGIRMLR